MKYFATSDNLIAKIGGRAFDQFTPAQRNTVRILNMYLSAPEATLTHENSIEELKPFADSLSIEISEPLQDKDVTYYTFKYTGNGTDEGEPEFTTDEMAEKIAKQIGADIAFVQTWPETQIKTAFENLRLAPKVNSSKPTIGYLLMDADGQVLRFKATTDSFTNVANQFRTELLKQAQLIGDK